MRNLKYFSVYLLIVTSMVSCAGDGWSRKEKSNLVDRCRLEGGSRSYCNCYLENAMQAYPIAKDMEEIEFEKAVELSINCK